MVTGRAGWMGMGRGAGRSALGFWPTLAFLLCSFPAGKALTARGAGTAGCRASSRPPPRLGAGRWRPPGGSGLPFPLVFCFSHSPRKARRCPGKSRGDPTRAALKRSRTKRSLGPKVPPNFPERGDQGRAPWRPRREGRGEARPRSRGRFPRLLTHHFANLPGVQGWPRGAPLRSWPGPRRPLLRDPAGPTPGARGLGSEQPVSLFDNIPRRPLFVFIVSERERISELKLKKPICFQ